MLDKHGEHPGYHQQPPHRQELPQRHISPAKQIRRVWQEAGRVVAEEPPLYLDNEKIVQNTKENLNVLQNTYDLFNVSFSSKLLQLVKVLFMDL